MRKMADLSREELTNCLGTIYSLEVILGKQNMGEFFKQQSRPGDEADAITKDANRCVNIANEALSAKLLDYNSKLADWLNVSGGADDDLVPAEFSEQYLTANLDENTIHRLVDANIDQLPDDMKNEISDDIKERIGDRMREYLKEFSGITTPTTEIATRGGWRQKIEALLQVVAENNLSVESIAAFEGLEYSYLRKVLTKESLEKRISEIDSIYCVGGVYHSQMMVFYNFTIDQLFILQGVTNLHHPQIIFEKAPLLRDFSERVRDMLPQLRDSAVNLIRKLSKQLFG